LFCCTGWQVGEALTDAEVDQLLEAVGATGETIKYDELVKVMTQR
jgi:Ca2+-binding EF-hand superfamily protein